MQRPNPGRPGTRPPIGTNPPRPPEGSIVLPIGTNPPRPPESGIVPPIGTNPPRPPMPNPPRPPVPNPPRPPVPNPSRPPVPNPSPTINCPSGYRRVTVGYNVDFPALMERYDVSYNALRAANPNRDPLNVLPGQQFCVPPSGTTAVCTGNRTYSIRSGDTLRTLPGTLNADTYAIFRANPNMIPSMFTPGQIICRP